MKIVVLILWVITCSVGFGQSAKKLNKQLWAELALQEKKQDSAYLVFKKSQGEYDSLRSLMTKKIRKVSVEEREVRNLWEDFLNVDNQLKALGSNPESVIINYPQKKGWISGPSGGHCTA